MTLEARIAVEGRTTPRRTSGELVFKEDGQEYAQVAKMLGNGYVEAQCFIGEKRIAHIRGKMRKKVWITQGDIILVSLREFQDGKGDIILKYNADEARFEGVWRASGERQDQRDRHVWRRGRRRVQF